MKLRTAMLAAAATTMAVAPTIVAAAPVAPSTQSLSLAGTLRAGTQTANKNDLAGSGLIIGIVAAVAVVVGIVIIADNNDSDSN